MYDSREEASNRLLGTIVSYDHRPLHVQDVFTDAGIQLTCREWPFNGRAKIVSLPLADVRFNGFRCQLGFVNYYDGGLSHTSWCERVPARRMQQGLVNANTQINSLGVIAARSTLDHVRGSDAFREMFAGEYPTFEEARAALVPESSIAIDRDLALLMSNEGYVTIYHRRDPLGLVLGQTIYLRADRLYAREMLVENARVTCEVQAL